jgi:uncharacterized membrane protein (DUF485 family)
MVWPVCLPALMIVIMGSINHFVKQMTKMTVVIYLGLLFQVPQDDMVLSLPLIQESENWGVPLMMLPVFWMWTCLGLEVSRADL